MGRRSNQHSLEENNAVPILTSPLIARIDVLPETPPGGEREPILFPHLSGSQLSALTRCGAAYYFARRLKIQEPLSSQTLKGSAFHEGMGAYQGLRRSGALEEDARQAARRVAIAYIKRELGYDAATRTVSAIVDFGVRWYKGPRDTPRSITLDVLAALDHVIADPAIQSLTPLSIERGYAIHWADPKVLPLTGFIDLAYADGAAAGILDFKTGGHLKGHYSLGLDLAQVGYAFGASFDLGRAVNTLTYATLTWEAPAENAEAAAVAFELQHLPLDPDRIERLYERCRQATEDLQAERFRVADNDMICPTCPFRYPCSSTFGALDASVLDSAAFAIQRDEAAALQTQEVAVVAPPPSSKGLSEKQRTWIVQLLQQCDITLQDAMSVCCLRVSNSFDDVDKKDASKLIDYLKPLAEKAVIVREQMHRVDRHIAQARAALHGVPNDVASAILRRHSLNANADIASATQASFVMADIANYYVPNTSTTALKESA